MKRGRLLIRTIVREIVDILKNKKSGLYYLPEYDDYYEINKFPINVSVELTLKKTNKIETFMVNGYYSIEDDVVEILILFNSKNLKQNLYNIIGELNEVITHELQHSIQSYNGDIDDLVDNSELPPLEYYLLPEEIDAQSKGFKRLSKLRKKPIELVMDEWFKNNYNIHNLNEEQQKMVMDAILQKI